MGLSSKRWRCGSAGATWAELSAAIGLQQSKVKQRIDELIRSGQVLDSQTTRPDTDGRPSPVFVHYSHGSSGCKSTS